VYGDRYWYGLATAVQTELARRGYYHGPIDGVIGSESREAIRGTEQLGWQVTVSCFKNAMTPADSL
jgi:hypothetical protein